MQRLLRSDPTELFYFFFSHFVYHLQSDSCVENVPGRRRKCRERVKSYQEYFEGDEDGEKENKKRKKTGGYNLPEKTGGYNLSRKTGGYNLSRKKLVCNLCQKRFLTRKKLQVRLAG